MIRSRYVALALLLTLSACASDATARPAIDTLPAPLDDAAIAPLSQLDTVYLAGGCFWGVEAVFEHVTGVAGVVSGYAGGDEESPSYARVSSGRTGHAETVRVIYDRSGITYGTLLQVFFSVAHDPTQLNRQGPDIGPQYRSAVFYTSAEQERVATAYIAQLTTAKSFGQPIVTEVAQLRRFYEAEPYHQDFAARNPHHPYIVYHDQPKLVRLKSTFAALYRATRSN